MSRKCHGYVSEEEPTCTLRGNAPDPKREGGPAGCNGGGLQWGRRRKQVKLLACQRAGGAWLSANFTDGREFQPEGPRAHL